MLYAYSDGATQSMEEGVTDRREWGVEERHRQNVERCTVLERTHIFRPSGSYYVKVEQPGGSNLRPVNRKPDAPTTTPTRTQTSWQYNRRQRTSHPRCCPRPVALSNKYTPCWQTISLVYLSLIASVWKYDSSTEPEVDSVSRETLQSEKIY